MTIFYFLTNTCVRIGILCYYRRIFATPSFRRLSMIVIGTCVLWCFPGVLIQLLSCLPLEANWNFLVPGKCIGVKAYGIIIACLEVVLDFIILVLPVREISRLQMSVQKKVALCCIFLIGGL